MGALIVDDWFTILVDTARFALAGTDWEHWFRQNEALASRVPYMVSIGNHEYDYTSDERHNDPSVTDGNYSVAVQVSQPMIVNHH